MSGAGKCPKSDQFHDPRNGGECWSCPSGYNRTVFPVTANNARERAGTSKLACTAAFNIIKGALPRPSSLGIFQAR